MTVTTRDTPRSTPQWTPVRGVLRTGWICLGVVAMLALLVIVAGLGYGYLTHTAYRPELSGSMRPLLQPGDLLAIEQVDASDAGVGDIVTLRIPSRNDELVTHRLIAVKQLRGGDLLFTTKGDANPVADPPGMIAPDAPVGRYGYRVPWLGRVVAATSGTVQRIVMIWVGVALLCLPWRRIARWRDRRGMAR